MIINITKKLSGKDDCRDKTGSGRFTYTYSITNIQWILIDKLENKKYYKRLYKKYYKV